MSILESQKKLTEIVEAISDHRPQQTKLRIRHSGGHSCGPTEKCVIADTPGRTHSDGIVTAAPSLSLLMP